MHTQLIHGPSGPLEIALWPRATRSAFVMCHPHPLYGGSMSNKVVTTLCSAFSHLHYLSLCFNFRGVGQSAGQFDHGEGEMQDTLAVIHWLKTEHSIHHIVLAGFSFGAYVALAASQVIEPQHLLLVAPPTSYPDFGHIKTSQAWSLITAEADEIIDTPAIERWADQQYPAMWRLSVKDASHFFHGKLTVLNNFVSDHFPEIS